MYKNVPAFIGALQLISDTDPAIIEKKFRSVCERQNFSVILLSRNKDMRFWSIIATPGKHKLFVKRFRPIKIFSERKKLDILIPHSGILGLPKIHGITDDWVIYEYIKGAYPNCIKSKRHLFEAVDHLLNMHKMFTGAPFAQHSFFRTKVATINWLHFVWQIPEIAKTIRHYGAPVIASKQLLMLLDRIEYKKKEYKKREGWIFTFPVPKADAFEKYDFVLCHGGYIPKHLFHTPQGLRVIDWETATLFSRWYDVWRLASFVPKKLTSTLWVRYIQGYLS